MNMIKYIMPESVDRYNKYFQATEDKILPIFISNESWIMKADLCEQLIQDSITFNNKYRNDGYESLKSSMNEIFSVLVYLVSNINRMSVNDFHEASISLERITNLFKTTDIFIRKNTRNWHFVDQYIYIDTEGKVLFDYNSSFVTLFTKSGNELKRDILKLYEGIMTGELISTFLNMNEV